ncbi:hypothetical protein [Sphaerisporangium sp. NPDC051011]
MPAAAAAIHGFYFLLGGVIGRMNDLIEEIGQEARAALGRGAADVW